MPPNETLALSGSSWSIGATQQLETLANGKQVTLTMLAKEPHHPEKPSSHDKRQSQEGQGHGSTGTEANEKQRGRWVLPGDAGMQPLQLSGHIIQQVLQRQGNPLQLVVLAPK